MKLNFSTLKLIIFDLDGTLTESKTTIDSEMAQLLCELLTKKKVAVISGASFIQFEGQFLSHLPSLSENLSILTGNGSAFFEYTKDKNSLTGVWRLVYEKKLSDGQKVLIRTAMDRVLSLPKIASFMPKKKYGELFNDIGAEMTFSALGQEAPLSEKEKWDPDHKKRAIIVAELEPLLHGIEMSIGGTTTINITVEGVDKEHAILELAKHFSISKNCLSSEILYVGDSIFEGGNDYGAVEAGVAVAKVAGPADTKNIIRGILTL